MKKTPTNFELVLKHRDKEALIPVILFLLEGNASMSFEWEMVMLERYRLFIEGSWADNLSKIASLLGDKGEE